MTGRIVKTHILGWGEIRRAEMEDRIVFDAGDLIDIPFPDSLGAEVHFDVLRNGKEPRAVRVRRRKATS